MIFHDLIHVLFSLWQRSPKRRPWVPTLSSFLQKIEESGHYKSNMVRFCYNAISDYECFSSTLEHFLENPLELAWLDLSFNDLSTIDKVLGSFYG